MISKSWFGAMIATFVLLPGLASANPPSSISSVGGCMNFLKGNDGQVSSCKSCVGDSGRYKRSAKGVWSCQQGSSSSADLSEMRPSVRAPTPAGPVRPKEMSNEHNNYVEIPAGKYKVGAQQGEQGGNADEMQAMVTITRPFLIKTTEVTQGDWHFIMEQPPVYYDADCGQDCPAGGIGWRQALEYLNALSVKEGLEQCYDLDTPLAVWTKGLDCLGYRLPTEAEWEYVARAGTKGPRYGELPDIAWTYDNSDGKRHPVGQKAPNAFEVYDMIGNVWEWTWDGYEYDAFSSAKVDPIHGMENKEIVDNRVMRGGSYRDNWIAARSAHRHKNPANGGSQEHGFRPVRTSPPAPKP